jgi:hypothetical protein
MRGTQGRLRDGPAINNPGLDVATLDILDIFGCNFISHVAKEEQRQ